MVTELALNQLNIAFLAVPPLVVLVLDDLLVTQRRRAVARRPGAWPVLVVVQFFVSTEVLVHHRARRRGRRGAAGRGLGRSGPSRRTVRPAAAAARRSSDRTSCASAVVLAYPLWFLLDGPAHLVGPIWSDGATPGTARRLSSFVDRRLGGLRPSMLRFGGYQGPALPGLGYLGLGVRWCRRSVRACGAATAAPAVRVRSDWSPRCCRSAPDTATGCRGTRSSTSPGSATSSRSGSSSW